MWVSLQQLIHDRVPDRKGNTLPVDVSSVTYDLEDLTPGGNGLMANAMAVDSSFGFQGIANVLRCCNPNSPYWNPPIFDLLIDANAGGQIWGTDPCTGEGVNMTPDFTTWGSNNPSVATVTTQQVHGVAAGSTDAWASGWISEGNASYCTVVYEQPTAQVTVTPQVSITSPAPTAVPVAQAQPGGSNVVGNNEVYISATCSPQGKVNPKFNWSVTEGSDEAKLDSTLSGGPTMGIIGIKGGAKNGVTVSVTCTDENTGTTSPAQTASMTAQQPGSLSIVAPDTTSEKNCTVQNTPGCETYRSFTYQVNDTNGSAMVFADLDFWDYITTGNANSCGLNSYAVTCDPSGVGSGKQTGSCGAKTGGSGQFAENLSVCAAVCGSVQNGKCSGNCSTQANQTWIVNGFSITKSLNYQCNSISAQ